ncbi:MAG: hypothetical protein ACJAZO_004425 [Myxococcota bacterium]|jgi:hypothetical protein
MPNERSARLDDLTMDAPRQLNSITVARAAADYDYDSLDLDAVY